MNKKYVALLGLLNGVLFIAACGGGGSSDSGAAAPEVSAPMFTGAVSAPLDTSNGVRTIYQRADGSGLTSEAVVQESHGAIAQFASCRMTGNYGAKEISGNAWFAMGRWTSGVRECTDSDTGKVLLDDLSLYGDSIHYVVAVPVKVAFANYGGGSPVACTDYAVTRATLKSGSSGSFDPSTRNVVISNGKIVFDSTGNAHVEFDVAAGVGSGVSRKTYDASLKWFDGSGYSYGISGVKGVSSRGLGPDGVVSLGGHGGDGVIVGGTYVVEVSSAKYLGAFTMLCR